jgi:taurine dioxygenase
MSNAVHHGPRVASRVPADWAERPYERFTIEPLSPIIGAEIGGIDLRDVDDDVFADIRRALLEWKVVFFRGQQLDRHEHATFARRFGDLETHPFFKHISLTPDQPDEDPEVVRFAKGPKAAGYENVWHTDVTWRRDPSMGAVLRAIEVPAVGGDTLWADMGAAYDGLPQQLRDQIDDLQAGHDWMPTFGQSMGAELIASLRPDFPAVVHPVVRTHPETGRRTLFVNRDFTTHIIGMDADESAALLDTLYRQADFPEYQVRFRWNAGDIAIWDNRATQHYAASDYFPQNRIMERVSIAGDTPY